MRWLAVLIAVAMSASLVGCTSECKQAAEKYCEKKDSKESRERCVALMVLSKCGGDS